MASAALANTAPTVVIQSAAMRPGTTLMDVVYRVNYPDDATVKTRALAFVDGVRSFAKVLKPVTFVEGTAAKLGDAIPANVDHTLTWDVGADWNIDLGQIKFEVLALDGRGLLPIDWITIPAAGENPALTISKNSPTDSEVLNALFWQFADGDSWLTLTNGVLTCNSGSGVFEGINLVKVSVIQGYSTAYLFKRMNLDPASNAEINHANVTARADLLNSSNWHAVNRPWVGIAPIVAWGSNGGYQVAIPPGLADVKAIAAGSDYSLALRRDGTVIGWGGNNAGQITIPAGLSNVVAIAAGGLGSYAQSLALKSDGTVIGWGANFNGQNTIPAGLNGVSAIAAGSARGLALKGDGSVVRWGVGYYSNPAEELTGITSIAMEDGLAFALKNNGTVIGWGYSNYGQATIPSGLSSVTAIDTSNYITVALKSDGTVVVWGYNFDEQTTIPTGLSGVKAIAAGAFHSLALKNDGTVIGWGNNVYGQTTIPAGLSGVTAIAAGESHSLALKAKAP